MRLRQVTAKRVGFAPDQRLAADRAAHIARQRIDEAEPPVQRIIVPSLAAARHIEAEIGPTDIRHAEGRDRPAAQRLVKQRGPLLPEHSLGASAQIGVQVRYKPVVPHLMRFRPVRLRVRKVLVDRAA